MNLIYSSSRGTVTMSGGGTDGIRITDIDGLGIAEREYTTVSYPYIDGQETVGSRAISRAITISFDIASNDAQALYSRCAAAFSESGRLYITDGKLSRSIYVNQLTVTEPKRHKRGYALSFAVQMICDDPYFESYDEISIPIYQRKKLISSPFTLPAVFGTTTTSADCYVDSVYDIEPIITLQCPFSLDESERVVITNSRTNKQIVLNYAPAIGEVITIDVKSRTIFSSEKGSILFALDDYTNLGDFVLLPGSNSVSATVGSIASGFTVSCIYRDRYTEAQII